MVLVTVEWRTSGHAKPCATRGFNQLANLRLGSAEYCWFMSGVGRWHSTYRLMTGFFPRLPVLLFRDDVDDEQKDSNAMRFPDPEGL